MTLSAMRSASCSNASPGLFTVIFVCTPAGTDCRDGAKKPPACARATKGSRVAWVTGDDVVLDAFSALVFMTPPGECPLLSKPPLDPQDALHPRQLDQPDSPGKPIEQQVIGPRFHLQQVIASAPRQLSRSNEKRAAQ